MNTPRSLLVILALLLPMYATADEAPDPPPNFGDCTARAQKKKTASSECQECNNIYQDGCEKKFKGTDLVRACQIKPKYSGEWREVWCKAPAKAEPAEKPVEPLSKAAEPATTPAPTKEPETNKTPEAKPPEAKAPEPTRAATEATKEGGCAVSPSGDGAWAVLALLLLLSRRKTKKENPQ